MWYWYGVDRINTINEANMGLWREPDHCASSSSKIKADLLQPTFTLKDVRTLGSGRECNHLALPPWIWGLRSMAWITMTWWLVFTETLEIGALAPKLTDHNLQIHLVTQATLSTWKMWPIKIGFIPKISKYLSSLPLFSTNPPCPKPIQTVSVPD